MCRRISNAQGALPTIDMKYILDTCVLSEFYRRNPSQSVIAWSRSVDFNDLYLSSVTIGEVKTGIHRLKNGDPRRAKLVSWYKDTRKNFAGRILDFTDGIAQLWGEIVGEAMCGGRPRPLIDMQIAATAIKHDMILVTRNTKDMEGVGVELLNPFEFQTNERK